MKDSTYGSRSNGSPNEHVVLIAGDLAGQARAAAFAYAKGGNHIVLASNNDSAGLKLSQELRARNVDAEFFHADTANTSEVQGVIAQAIARYGHLDVQYLQ